MTSQFSGLVLLLLLRSLQAQPARPNGLDREDLEPVQPESPLFMQRKRSGCGGKYRTFDGTCSSFGSPSQKLWASTNRPLHSYFVNEGNSLPHSTVKASARFISNSLCKQSRDVFDERFLNEMTTFFGQFIDHTIVATTTNKAEPYPIQIPEGDPLFSNFSKGQLPFFRSARVRVREMDMEERPQNTVTSVVDLGSVYGVSEERNKQLRTMSNGLMKTSTGDMLPLNQAMLNNAPNTGPEFFLAGDHRANEHPVLTSLHTVFLREHNELARRLRTRFPEWDDEMLFQNARKINIAQMQKIVFEEWYPAITGRSLPRYNGFNPIVNPTVSIVFSTAAFRVGHTMVGNQVNRRGNDNTALPPFNLMSMFFRSAAVMKSHGIEEFLRGALVSRAQKVDLQVNDALRNFLFTGVDGEDGLDLVALNLQRGRDHAVPSFNAVRSQFGLPRAVQFSEISSNVNVQSALQSVYGSARLVEAWIGLVAEDHARGSSMGETLLRVWEREFRRLRDGDSFYFRAEGAFSGVLRSKMRRVRKLFEGEDLFRGVLLRNTGIAEHELPKRVFFAA